jgi:hypothetical protein
MFQHHLVVQTNTEKLHHTYRSFVKSNPPQERASTKELFCYQMLPIAVPLTALYYAQRKLVLRFQANKAAENPKLVNISSNDKE